MNRIKKLMKKTYENSRKRKLKEYHRDKWMLIQTSFPAIAYIIIFGIQSIIDNTFAFSIELAIFSCCVTISFEINEWCIYYNRYHNKGEEKTIKIFNYFPPLLFASVLIMLVAFVYNGFATLIGIPEEILPIIPNFITSLTLFAYFISYIKRNIKLKEKEDLA